ncbi:MAG TPA: hypothetical protein VHX88_02930 [Solirubrobacteraceae bacterium]|jgi:hypothetical protein|nr:hypothetical protein [Solirubrobacteraceae bacterium]
MCPTILGRLETRTVVLIGPAIVGAILSLAMHNEGFIVIIGVYLLLGSVLDIAIYPFVLQWQPPWLTFVLAIVEFVLLYVLSQILKIHLTHLDAVWFFWLSWTMANWTKVVILPIVSLSWIENAGEFRSTDWSVPPEFEPLPLLAQPASTVPGALAREFSSVIEVPAELRALPAPSGVHEVPE